MNPNNNSFFILAQTLLDNLPQNPALKDAYFRTAISRAYFAIYNEAYNALPKTEKDKLSRNADAHQEVMKLYFGNKSNPVHVEIGEALDNLRKLRNPADYNRFMDNIEFKAKLALQQAKTTLEKL